MILVNRRKERESERSYRRQREHKRKKREVTVSRREAINEGFGHQERE
jgi:hypothetical protein